MMIEVKVQVKEMIGDTLYNQGRSESIVINHWNYQRMSTMDRGVLLNDLVNKTLNNVEQQKQALEAAKDA